MRTAYIVGTFDVAELAFFLFFFFFIGLVLYLARESRREGYPLEDEITGRVESVPLLNVGDKKTFKLPHGRGTYVPEDLPRDELSKVANIPAKQTFNGGGAPWVPTGDPMKDGVGAASYAERADYPDLTFDGRPRIVPIGESHDIMIAPQDHDIVGWPVVAADKKVAGTVTDVWVDQSEHLIRYIEVETNAGDKVLAPMFVAVVGGKGLLTGIWPDKPDEVEIDAITSDQFADVPRIATAGQITRLEEDKIQAYYGGGYLHATPERSEPWI
ncbi:MAG: photosynthetic reaction center subunit H [Pseudomonadota bacterium]